MGNRRRIRTSCADFTYVGSPSHFARPLTLHYKVPLSGKPGTTGFQPVSPFTLQVCANRSITPITDAGLTNLDAGSSLELLWIMDTRVTEAGMWGCVRVDQTG